MKKLISCLLAVVLLVSLSVSAFAAEHVSLSEGCNVQEVVSAVDKDGKDVAVAVAPVVPEGALQNAIDDFNTFFDSSADLQLAAGDNGVEVSSAFSFSADAEFPVSAVLKLEKADAFVALLRFDGENFVFVPSTLDGDKLSADLTAAGDYVVLAKKSLGLGADGDAYIVETPSTFVNSAEVKGEPTVVKATDANAKNVDAFLIVTPFDVNYTLDKLDRERFGSEVNALADGFEQFLADHKEYEGTAPSEAVYMSSNKPAELKLPASLTLRIDDSDIFAALIVCENNEWKAVDATVDAAGNLVFSVSELGSYVILSQAAVG